MRKLASILAGAATAALMSGGAASAADWNGFYAGISLGASEGESQSTPTLGANWDSATLIGDRDFVASTWTTSQSTDGVEFGIQGGYKHQFEGGLVMGIEGDYTSLDASASRQTGVIVTTLFRAMRVNNSIDAEQQFSIRARGGYASDNWLFYGTAGWSMAEVTGTAQLEYGVSNHVGSQTEWLGGVVYGAGAERMLGSNWSVRAEYLTADYGDFDYAPSLTSSINANTVFADEVMTQDFETSSFRVGLNYHF